jgi:sorbitol-6-phosphate 2-dehydrogenase
LNLSEGVGTMKAELIAPLLRGLTFNGEAAAVIRFSKEELNGSGVLSLRSPDELNSIEAGIKTVTVKGVGSFAIGAPQRVAVVTGGAQGFGAGIVKQLVKKNIFVFIADMNLAGAESFASELNAESGKITAAAVEVNVADEASVENMINEVVLKAGGLDLFVNNAGVLKAGSVKEQALSDFEFVTKVNYTGYFLCVKYASRVMASQNAAAEGAGLGRYFTDIIQINSKSGLQGSNKNGAYAGGKFGGIGLTQSFAMELVTDNIKVNSICPGNFFEGPLWSDPERGLFVQYLNTGKVPGAKTIADVKSFYEAKVPMGRGCQPEDIARALFYLVEQKYETGQALPVTGGQVMLK